MNIFSSIKVMVAPLLSFISIVLYFYTKNKIYFFVSGGFLVIFTIAVSLILLFIIFKFGLDSIIESEIDAIPWLNFFIALSVFLITSIFIV